MNAELHVKARNEKAKKIRSDDRFAKGTKRKKKKLVIINIVDLTDTAPDTRQKLWS